MRVVAVSRFRLLTMVRTATPLFLLAVLPPAAAAVGLSIPEPVFRDGADFFLAVNAFAAMLAWLLHTAVLSFAALMSGKVRTAHDFVIMEGVPDLMDTAPVSDGARFWGEALGTFATAALVHLCCLPLLAAIFVLSPLPTIMFVWMEAAALALFVLAGAGAAWQRRARRTKYSGSRGPRNVFAVALLALAAVLLTTQPRAFRDALLEFFANRPSMRSWSEVVGTIESPVLLVTLLALLYAGTIGYYYLTATRRRAWEN
ncbi:MAG TPA: hypothetical protein VNA04_13445 [Thermoanaerobaculia bacterium]|nr:hypothetical protein [Thermoanaerobaculia bacterium]